MKLPTLLLRGLLAGALLLSALPSRAGTDRCALLEAADLTALLGGAAVATPRPSACTWKGGAGRRKLMVVEMKATGSAAAMAYAGARGNAGKDPKDTVTDLSGIGDKAFAVQTSFGVALFLVKQGRLLQLQYWTEAQGTPADLAALRPVARKAAAAF